MSSSAIRVNLSPPLVTAGAQTGRDSLRPRLVPVPRFVVLGPLEVDDGRDVQTPRAHKQRIVLAILLVRANMVVSTDTLIAELWGDHPPRTALKALRVYISQLRRFLATLATTGAEPAIVTRDPGYRLELDLDALDLTQFEHLCGLGKLARSEGDLASALRHYRAATALWRGPALADVRSAPLLEGVAQRLEEQRFAAMERALELEIRLGGHAEAISELRALAADYPLREQIHYHLMVALTLAGRRGEALQAYRELRGTYISELGMEPGQELQLLHQAILDTDQREFPQWDSWEH